MGVEGHVEKQRAAAGGEGAGAGGEAFPIRAAGLVEMDVGINEAGKDVEARGVEGFAGLGGLAGREELELSFGNGEVGGANG
jgi:hypothetical protein